MPNRQTVSHRHLSSVCVWVINSSGTCWNMIPAFIDVDGQLDVASHYFLEDGAVCVVVAFSKHRQLALVSANGNLATVYPIPQAHAHATELTIGRLKPRLKHSVAPSNECAVKLNGSYTIESRTFQRTSRICAQTAYCQKLEFLMNTSASDSVRLFYLFSCKCLGKQSGPKTNLNVKWQFKVIQDDLFSSH